MEICELCKTKLVDFYHFKKRSEQVRTIKSNCISSKSQDFDDPTEDKSVYNLVQIVRDYISKHSVVEIREEEFEGRLVVESTSCQPKQSNQDDYEVKVFKTDVATDELEESFLEEGDIKPEVLEPEYLEEEEDYLPTDDSTKEIIDESVDIDYDVVEFDDEGNELINEYEESDDFSYTNQQSASESATDLSRPINPRRMRHPENWACNRRKTLRNSGQSYRNSKGKTVDAKQMRESCGESCRSKCVTKISEADRQRAFEQYWGLGDVVKQRKFVYKHITSAEPKRRRAVNSSSRSVTLQFYLEALDEDETYQLVQVCKKMFKNTLVISSQVIQGVVKKYAIQGFNDTRGKFERKLTEAQKLAVEHVKKFPFFYIEQVLTKVDCYNMYKQECSKLGLEPVKEGNYRDIFDKQNQGSFLKTMKVSCEMCHRYYRGTDEEREALQKEHDIHISLGVNKKCRDRHLGRLRHKRAQERKKAERIAANIKVENKSSTPD